MNFNNTELLEEKPKLGQRLMLLSKHCSDARLSKRLKDIVAMSHECQQTHDSISSNLLKIEQNQESRISMLLHAKR